MGGASQEEGGGESERSQRGRDVAQQDICSAVAISPGNGQSFCGKYSQCFCFCTESFSCFFKLLFYFRNFQHPRQIPTTKTLPHIYGSCCCCCRCCKVRGIYLLTPRKTSIRETRNGDRNRNRNQNRIDMNCERLRYFRFGHLPDYFVLCLRIGPSTEHWPAAEVGSIWGKVVKSSGY